MMQPEWTGIEVNTLAVKFGQVLKFDNDSIDLTAIVLDFNEDEGGQWIGVCFIDRDRLFGRRIPNGMNSGKCIDLLDLTYIRKDALIGYQIIGMIPVNRTKVGIGSQSPVVDPDGIIRDFVRGMARRKERQTPCDKGLLDPASVRECYLDIGTIKD